MVKKKTKNNSNVNHWTRKELQEYSNTIARANNHPDIMCEKIKKLEDRVRNLELKTPGFLTANTNPPKSKFKVGDYVDYYYQCILSEGTEKRKGEITFINDYNTYFIKEAGDSTGLTDAVYEEDIIGYAKPDLLTPEEKDFLINIIKNYCAPDIEVSKGETNNIVYIYSHGYQTLVTVETKYNDLKFMGLKGGRVYTLKELGL